LVDACGIDVDAVKGDGVVGRYSLSRLRVERADKYDKKGEK